MKTILTLLLGIITLLPKNALAHVRYLSSELEQRNYGQSNFDIFFAPLQDPKYVVMILATIFIIILVYWYCDHNRYIHKWTDHMTKIGESYKQFIPWITRLSLGILLISGATNAFLISPVVENGSTFISLVQLVTGFFLMAGFLTGISAVVALFLFTYALFQDPYLIGSFDILALILSLFALDSRRPGVDDILDIPDWLHEKKLREYLPTILRVGVGIGMSYLAFVEKILTPELASLVVERSGLIEVIPVSSGMWTFSAGIIELLVGLMLIVGWKTRIASVAALVILSLSFFYFGEDVSSHVTLFGILSAVFILGVGKLGIDAPHTVK